MQTVLARLRVALPPHPLMERYYTNEFTYNEYPHKSFWPAVFTRRGPQDCTQGVTLRRRRVATAVPEPAVLQEAVPVLHLLHGHHPGLCPHPKVPGGPGCRDRPVPAVLRPGRGHARHPGDPPGRRVADPVDRAGLRPPGGCAPTIVAFDQRPRFSPGGRPARGARPQRLEFYADRGVNRLSFGVQEFDVNVQKAIGRVQPASLLEGLLTPSIRGRFDGINFDVLCGLPRQTAGSFRKTIGPYAPSSRPIGSC